MKKKKTIKTISLTLPDLKDPGGVANFYNCILPHLGNEKYTLKFLEIGSTKGGGGRFYWLNDQLRLKKAFKDRPALVHVNPSLNLKSFIRDGLFVWQAKQKGLPVLIFFHGWGHEFAELVEKKLPWFFKKTFGQADAFIVFASEFEQKLQRWEITAPIYRGSTAVDDKLLADFDLKTKLDRFAIAHETNVLFFASLRACKGGI